MNLKEYSNKIEGELLKNGGMNQSDWAGEGVEEIWYLNTS